MSHLNGIDLEAIVTVNEHTELSCEMINAQTRLHFGKKYNGLQLYLEEEGLNRILDVLDAAMAHRRRIKPGAEVCFTISADMSSRNEHALSYRRPDPDELLVSDVVIMGWSATPASAES